MRYYIKCRIDPAEKQKVSDSINNGSIGHGKVFHEGMQTALREATIDGEGVVHLIEICYCLEGGLYPMAMEIPELNKYFNKVVEVKDARSRSECTMECEACDCTRAIKLPGMQLVKNLNLGSNDTDRKENDKMEFIDYGRVELRRHKQRQDIDALRKVVDECLSSKIKPVMAGAAISGLFAIFHDDNGEYFRIKNIPDTNEARHILVKIGLDIHDSVESVKDNAKCSLAGSDRYSNIV